MSTQDDAAKVQDDVAALEAALVALKDDLAVLLADLTSGNPVTVTLDGATWSGFLWKTV